MHTDTHPAFGSRTIARGIVPTPVLKTIVKLELMKSKTPTIAKLASVKYNLLVTQLKAKPSKTTTTATTTKHCSCAGNGEGTIAS